MKKGFNLAGTIRGELSKNAGIEFPELLKVLRSAGGRINEGTARATFYKLRAGGKRRVKRVRRPVLNGAPSGLASALELIRSTGSVAAAREKITEVAGLLDLAKGL